MRISQRDFVKSATASGIALSITPLAIAEEPNFAARETLPGRNPAATGVGRIDGVAKVTGAKLYASDFRAADLANWPQTTSHAMLPRNSIQKIPVESMTAVSLMRVRAAHDNSFESIGANGT